jgi:hypothetical protein
MKKIISLMMVLLILSVAAMAQRGPSDRFIRHRVAYGVRGGEINRVERFRLQNDVARYQIAQRHARRDGMVTPYERRRIHAMKGKTRRDAYRFRHNSRRRTII